MSEVWVVGSRGLTTAFFSVSNLKACRTSELEGQQHVLLIERVVSSILKNAQGLLNWKTNQLFFSYESKYQWICRNLEFCYILCIEFFARRNVFFSWVKLVKILHSNTTFWLKNLSFFNTIFFKSDAKAFPWTRKLLFFQ